MRAMSDEQIKNILLSSRSRQVAAQKLGITIKAVDRHKKRLGLTGGHNVVTTEHVIAMREMELKGFAYTTIGKHLGFTESTVRKHLSLRPRLMDDPINKLLMSPMSQWGQCLNKKNNNEESTHESV